MCTSLIEQIEESSIKFIDVRFTDLQGRWRHINLTANDFKSACEEGGEGILVDTSTVPGWRDINEADLTLRILPGLDFVDPFAAQATLVVLTEMSEPGTELDYERDPRSVLRRALDFAENQSIADSVMVDLDFGFHLFQQVSFDTQTGRCSAVIQDPEFPSEIGQRTHFPLLGAEMMAPSYSLPPADNAADIRAEMTAQLSHLGIENIRHWQGGAVALQQFSLQKVDLLRASDELQIAKYVISQVAASYGRTATFLPKPLSDGRNHSAAGAGLVLGISMFRQDVPVFAGSGYADLSETCLHFIGGVLRHGRALNALTNATTNSYRRLRSGKDAPYLLAFAAHNRSAALRIPYVRRREEKKAEIRFADPSCNPYLACAAVLMAGLDGIAKKLEPGDAVDRNLYDLRPEDRLDLPMMCRSLDEALDALLDDHEFLLTGDVFAEELVQAYVEIKRDETEQVESVPHPRELALFW